MKMQRIIGHTFKSPFNPWSGEDGTQKNITEFYKKDMPFDKLPNTIMSSV